MKKIFGIIAAAVMTMTVFTACTSTDGGKEDETTTTTVVTTMK